MPRRAILAVALILLTATGTAMAQDAEIGKPLAPVATLDAPGAMDAAISGNHVFYIGSGALYAADISDPLHPKAVGKVAFGGKGRQMAIEGNLACVTARTDGLYLFDISDPANPRMLSHYDTIHLGTGIDLNGDLAFVAECGYGVEIVDISDPAKPRHVTQAHTSEAQSVAVRGHYLYVGDWWVSQLTIIDIADPRAPRVISHSGLDGFGDGLDVQGDWVYSATGHHSHKYKEARRQGIATKPGSPGYGEGHGLEVWSVADPEKPVFASRVKFPPHFTTGGYDMWSVRVSGGYAFSADSGGGVLVTDVSDPHNAKIAAHYNKGLVGGLAVGDGAVYAACPKKGLVVLDATGMAQIRAPERGEAVALPPVPKEQPTDHRLYQPGGQIRSMTFVGDYAVVAAGMEGVRVLEMWPEVREVSHIDTASFAFYVDACGDRLYVAEARGGLGIYEHAGNGAFKEIGRFMERQGRAIRCVRVNGQNRYAIAESNLFLFIDVSDPASPRQLFRRSVAGIYGDQITYGLVDDHYVGTSGHRHPLRWYDLKADPDKVDTGVDLARKMSPGDGAVSVGDRLLVVRAGGYQLAPALATDIERSPLIKCDERLNGKPRVYGNGLYTSLRSRKQVQIVDISDIEKPRLLHTIKTQSNPGTVAVRNGSLIICEGYNGLAIYDDFVAELGLDVDAKAFLPGD